jgi:hypothetical protein
MFECLDKSNIYQISEHEQLYIFTEMNYIRYLPRGLSGLVTNRLVIDLP